MQVVICDDDEGYCSLLEGWIQKFRQEEKADINVSVYNSVESLELHLQKAEWIDLIFLDIELPEKTGIEFGKELREYWENDAINIVFISGKNEYCMELFEIEPMNFHHKPMREKDIVADLTKVMKRCVQSRKVIQYREDGVCKGIFFKDILYIESVLKKIEVVTRDGKRIVMRQSLGALEDNLVQNGFCRCHRAYVVNVSCIERYIDQKITMRNGDVITVGGKYAPSLKIAIKSYRFTEG